MLVFNRVVPILILVPENATDNAKNGGISKNANLCTCQIPCYLLAAKQNQALTEIDFSLPLYNSSPKVTLFFKSGEEERKEPTALAKCPHSAIFYI